MATLEEELAELATLTASQNAVAMMIRAKSGDEALLSPPTSGSRTRDDSGHFSPESEHNTHAHGGASDESQSVPEFVPTMADLEILQQKLRLDALEQTSVAIRKQAMVLRSCSEELRNENWSLRKHVLQGTTPAASFGEKEEPPEAVQTTKDNDGPATQQTFLSPGAGAEVSPGSAVTPFGLLGTPGYPLSAHDLTAGASPAFFSPDAGNPFTPSARPVYDGADHSYVMAGSAEAQIHALRQQLAESELRASTAATHTLRLSAALLDVQQQLSNSQQQLSSSQQQLELGASRPAQPPPQISVSTVDADALRDELARTSAELTRVKSEKRELEARCDTLQRDDAELQRAARELREAAAACKSQIAEKSRENHELQRQVSKLSRSKNRLRDSLRQVKDEQSSLAGQLQIAAAQVRDDSRLVEQRTVHFQVQNVRMGSDGQESHRGEHSELTNSPTSVSRPGLAASTPADLRTMATSLSQLQHRMEEIRDSSSCASSVSGWSSGEEGWAPDGLKRTRGYTPHSARRRARSKSTALGEAGASRKVANELRRQTAKLNGVIN